MRRLSDETNSKLFLTGACARLQKGRGLTFTFVCVLCLSTSRWARLSTHGHRSPHLLCCPCSHAHFDHAAGQRYFFGGAPSPLCDSVHVRNPRTKKLERIFPELWLSFVSVPTRVFRSAARQMYRITHTCTSKYLLCPGHQVTFKFCQDMVVQKPKQLLHRSRKFQQKSLWPNESTRFIFGLCGLGPTN